MDRLQANQQLNVNDKITSNNGLFTLVMQGDGNLVLYRTDNRSAPWASNTWGSPANRAVMQGDGNFVVYGPDGHPYWNSGTAGYPGACVVVQDDGNLVVYDKIGTARWASNTAQSFSPTIQYTDARGYAYNETSEAWKRMCQAFPCFAALQWPGYATDVRQINIGGQDVVVQLWKGWCPKFLGLPNFPGGNGAEVGIYRKIRGRVRPTILPFLPPSLAATILGGLATLSDDMIWWPYPELNTTLEYELINPETNQAFFHAGPEKSYWLAKWMDDGSYSKYQKDQGKKWPWLPDWWPGNSRTPGSSTGYVLDYTINGQRYPRW
jgi:hypothetical protein